MADPAPLSQVIDEEARKPRFAVVDGQQLSRRTIGELIEADRHAASVATSENQNPFFGMRVNSITPGGCG